MTLFLIGFMGCGKTTLGKKLALQLGYQFIDMDREIEGEIGMTISQYFDQFGEDEFRKVESRVLKQKGQQDKSVIATGGGSPCFFDNMEWMNGNGTTIYISLSPNTLAKRLEKATEKRPVLNNLRGQDLEDFITDKLATREDYYKQAELIVDGIDLFADKMMIILDEYQRR